MRQDLKIAAFLDKSFVKQSKTNEDISLMRVVRTISSKPIGLMKKSAFSFDLSAVCPIDSEDAKELEALCAELEDDADRFVAVIEYFGLNPAECSLSRHYRIGGEPGKGWQALKSYDEKRQLCPALCAESEEQIFTRTVFNLELVEDEERPEFVLGEPEKAATTTRQRAGTR